MPNASKVKLTGKKLDQKVYSTHTGQPGGLKEISYKELMEKKDSIQTIDEEEAIISIEELMNRNNKKQIEEQESSKLYNLTESEKNDDFIKELKQFRNDL